MIKLFENFANVKDVRDEIFLVAVKTLELDIIKFFVDEGYDINADGVLLEATYNIDIFKYFLENNVDVKVLNDDWKSQTQLENDEIQMILIDFGHEVFVHDSVGFNPKLKRIPKYADVVGAFENVEKYNL